ncbi:UNVERIFIED_CONTAM: hypothetical protein Slati_0518100 [Sesamum latifolium]|uniref:Uncharacterized protein n=1 Tax=Sesamum latifolium TaxID=2727402 RepID=A0AAW2XZX0_9LAMI
MERAFEVGRLPRKPSAHVLRMGRPERVNDRMVTTAACPSLPFAIITATPSRPFDTEETASFRQGGKRKRRA